MAVTEPTKAGNVEDKCMIIITCIQVHNH